MSHPLNLSAAVLHPYHPSQRNAWFSLVPIQLLTIQKYSQLKQFNE